MSFYGRKREMAAINSGLIKERNIILTGKFGIGKTTLVKEFSRINRERWLFLFSDFSETPSKICQDLLKALKPKIPSRELKQVSYKKCRSMILDMAHKSEQRCVIVLDNIKKLTPQKLDLIRHLEWDRPFIFIAIPENFLPVEDLLQLRTSLYPSRVIRLQYLSSEQTTSYFRYYSIKHNLSWTESHIHMLTLATRGYPLEMREHVNKAKKG